jgi:hypothetical protein
MIGAVLRGMDLVALGNYSGSATKHGSDATMAVIAREGSGIGKGDLKSLKGKKIAAVHWTTPFCANARMSERSHWRSPIASAVQFPCLKLPLPGPLGAPGLSPPCRRQRARRRIAGHWQGAPARVLAPQRGARRRFASRVSRLWFMGLISCFSDPSKDCSVRSRAPIRAALSKGELARVGSRKIGRGGDAAGATPATAFRAAPARAAAMPPPAQPAPQTSAMPPALPLPPSRPPMPVPD